MTKQQDTLPLVRRRSNDSSALTAPRAFIRVFTAPGTLESRTRFYEEVQGLERDMWITYPAKGLALAAVGGFLVIEGADEDIAPFLSAAGTLLVDDAAAHLARLTERGAEIVEPLHQVPTGAAFYARHPDGTVVEYVEHRPTPDGD
ncbi:VOC family protein [Streptomyces sp. NBC_00083]|uniref:VOC family protein n=1 Tax=Streptomyces sp. NBC_00083 TaxID=2975647 RepID=UPI0022541845|nr:VOC family protein [Streptomyces sp. NBC_00083]MCX5385270.1 VOC family protein [Streptomyces sp. NBC_00083]